MHGEVFHITNMSDPLDGWAAGATPPGRAVIKERRRNPMALLRHAQCHAGAGASVVGLKVFHDHLRSHNWYALTGWCDVCVLLRRHDVAAQYRSLLRARATGQWKGRIANASALDQSRELKDLRQGYTEKNHRRNMGTWYRTVSAQLAARRDAPSATARPVVVELSFEDDVAGLGGPRLGALWKALGLEQPKALRAR